MAQPLVVDPIVGELAIVRPNAELFADRGLKTVVMRPSWAAAGVPVRITKVSDGVVSVATVGNPTCYAARGLMEWADLSLHVRQADLATVLREEHSVGDTVTLLPGVVVEADHVRVGLGGHRPVSLPVLVPQKKLGLSHPIADGPPPPQEEGEALRAGVTVKFEGASLRLEEMTKIYELKPDGETVAGRLVGRCGTAVVEVSKTDLRVWGPGGSGILGGLSGSETTVAQGTELRWSDGSVAGRVTRDAFLDARIEGSDPKCWRPREFVDGAKLCAPAENVVEETFGVGAIGKGSGGKGSGYGRGTGGGFGGLGKGVPRVRQGAATVKGALDKDIIRRIVRAHINEVRNCYNKGLQKDEKLEGGVEVDFTIGANGKVTKSKVVQHTVTPEVANCIAKSVKRWKFPRPSGGATVDVNYPFALKPG